MARFVLQGGLAVVVVVVVVTVVDIVDIVPGGNVIFLLNKDQRFLSAISYENSKRLDFFQFA